MMVQILLLVFLVGFSAAETQDPIRENFSQFFNAIAVNDTGEISKQGDILRAEVVKQKETFDAIGRRRTGFVLSSKNSSLVKRDGGLLVNGDADRFLNDEERGYVSEARGLMEVAKLTEAKDQVEYLLHLYAKERSANEKAKTLRIAAEKDKKAAQKLSRQLSCPTKVRHWLEYYDVNFLNDPGNYERKSQMIESTIRQEYRNALNMIEQAVRRLNGTLSKLASKNNEFEDAWKILQKSLPSHQLIIQFTQMDPLQSRSNSGLGHALDELADLNDVDYGRKMWLSQCSVKDGGKCPLWNVLPGDFTPSDRVAFENLAYAKIMSLPDKLGREDPDDEEQYVREFAMDFILSTRYFRTKFTPTADNKYYKKCRRVLYFSRDLEIEKVRQSLKEGKLEGANATNVPHYRRMDRFCEIFGRLWVSVSRYSEHTGGVEVSSEECLPTSEDFEEYVNRLKTYGRNDYVFVIKSMCTACDLLPSKIH